MDIIQERIQNNMRMFKYWNFQIAAISLRGFASACIGATSPRKGSRERGGVVSIASGTPRSVGGKRTRRVCKRKQWRKTSEKVPRNFRSIRFTKNRWFSTVRQADSTCVQYTGQWVSQGDTRRCQVSGYEAGNYVSVTVREIFSKLGQLLDAVVAEGANDFNWFAIRVSRINEAAFEQAR